VTSQALADTSSVIVTGAELDDRLTIDGSFPSSLPISFHGGMGTNTLIGPAADSTWTITGPDAGSVGSVQFTGIGNLTGRNGTDEFNMLVGGSISGQIDGGDGDNTLSGPDTDNTWMLSGADAGMLNATRFAAIENITGGNAVDDFRMQNLESISGEIDGGAGIDTLTGPDADNDWSLSGANAGTLNDTDFFAIENLTGGNADDEFKVGGSGSLTGLLDGGLFDVAAPTEDSLDF
jgi:hypothetical protein